MKTCYICSPYRAQTEAELDNNIDYAQQLTKLALAAGLAPITVHLYLTQVTNDNIPESRAQGLAAGKELLKQCDVVIVGNERGVSEGMQGEIDLADNNDIPILCIDKTVSAAELKEMIERATA